MHRRELLQVGSLGLAGLGSDLLAGLQRTVRGAEAPRAKSCVFLFLFGGPSQIDLKRQKGSGLFCAGMG